MNTIISTPTIKSIYIVKEIWWSIKEYVFGNEYWKRRFAPSLKSITEWAGEYCHSAYLDMKVGNFTPGSRRWSEILTRVNCRNIYRQCHLKEVEKQDRPKDLPRGMEVNEYQYSIHPLAEWDRMFIVGGFIQGEEMGDTYGVRRNDAPVWVEERSTS